MLHWPPPPPPPPPLPLLTSKQRNVCSLCDLPIGSAAAGSLTLSLLLGLALRWRLWPRSPGRNSVQLSLPLKASPSGKGLGFFNRPMTSLTASPLNGPQLRSILSPYTNQAMKSHVSRPIPCSQVTFYVRFNRPESVSNQLTGNFL